MSGMSQISALQALYLANLVLHEFVPAQSRDLRLLHPRYHQNENFSKPSFILTAHGVSSHQQTFENFYQQQPAMPQGKIQKLSSRTSEHLTFKQLTFGSELTFENLYKSFKSQLYCLDM